MLLPIAGWISLIASAIVLVEIIILCILYRKLLKKTKAPKNETLYAAAGAPVGAALLGPAFTVCAVLLILEAVFYLWLIIRFVRLLKDTEDDAVQAPVVPAEPEPEPLPQSEPEHKPEPQPEPIDETAPVAEVEELVRDAITISEAHDALSDEFALHLIEEDPTNDIPVEPVAIDPAHPGETQPLSAEPRYKNKTIINVDTLSENFDNYSHINLDTLKAKGLIPAKTDFVKVLGRGLLDKHLIVELQDFSADAVKMIVLTGGHAIHKK